ncbi:sugar ABC transporter substrate-binding protein [Clostridium carnis]
MKFKKILVSLMALAVAGSTIVGCSSTNKEDKTTKDGEAKKVTVWCWDKAFNGAALQIAEEIYKKDHPDFQLDIVDMSKVDLEQKLNTNLVSGVEDGLPDIVLANDINVNKYVNSYQGAFVDLSGSVNLNDFAKYKVDGITVDGKTYAVPFDIGSAGMFYRRDYIEKAGFTSKDLENITWDRYIEIGKVVKEKTGYNMLTITPSDDVLIPLMLTSAGSWFITKDNKGNFENNPVLTEALNTYKKIYDADIAKPVTGWSEFVSSFNNGDVATVISAVWQIPTIMQEKSQSGKWGIAQLPRLNVSGAKNASNEGGSSWMVLESSKSKKTAIDFLAKTIGGSSDFYSQFLTKNGGVGSYTKAFESEAYKQPVEFFGGQKVYQEFAEWSKEIPASVVGMYSHEGREAIRQEIPNIVNGANIQDSLKNAQKLYEQQTK